ncbi:hypothetical protein B5H09_15315 [Listeria monocytogenes]|nr:hypothetical protein [Listeria monocytogenes]
MIFLEMNTNKNQPRTTNRCLFLVGFHFPMISSDKKTSNPPFVKQVTNDIGGFSTPTRRPYSVSLGQRVLIPSQAWKI